MSKEKVFINGLIIKQPNENAPDFVKMRLSFKVGELVEFLKANDNDGWVNADIKESQNGKLYAELDTWKPKGSKSTPEVTPEAAPEVDSDFPF